MSWVEAVLSRLAPASADPDLTLPVVVALVLTAAIVVLIDPIWRVLRMAVTLAHELGHALVGVVCGRRFTGFVLRGDSSGHAVTYGPPRGPGRIATTWAGYPMPGVVALGLLAAVSRGYAAALLALLLLVLIFALPRVRSLLTAAVVFALGAVLSALWWWRDDTLQAMVLAGAALVLLVGGWRHLGDVLSDSSPGRDPAVLRQLSGIPIVVWNGSFAATLALSTWGVWRILF